MILVTAVKTSQLPLKFQSSCEFDDRRWEVTEVCECCQREAVYTQFFRIN
jgi:hypothetical protein